MDKVRCQINLPFQTFFNLPFHLKKICAGLKILAMNIFDLCVSGRGLSKFTKIKSYKDKKKFIFLLMV